MTAGGLMFAAEDLAAPQLAETRAHTTGARSVPVHMHATWPGLNLESRDPRIGPALPEPLARS